MVKLDDLPDPERKGRRKFFKGLETRGKTGQAKKANLPSDPKTKASKAKIKKAISEARKRRTRKVKKR